MDFHPAPNKVRQSDAQGYDGSLHRTTQRRVAHDPSIELLVERVAFER